MMLLRLLPLPMRLPMAATSIFLYCYHCVVALSLLRNVVIVIVEMTLSMILNNVEKRLGSSWMMMMLLLPLLLPMPDAATNAATSDVRHQR